MEVLLLSIIKITYWNIICTDVYCCLVFFSLTIPLGNSYNAFCNIGSLLSCTHAHTWDTSSFGPQALHCLVVFDQVSVSVCWQTILVHRWSLIDCQQGSMACLLLESLCCLQVERQTICFHPPPLTSSTFMATASLPSLTTTILSIFHPPPLTAYLWLLPPYFDVFLRSSFIIFTGTCTQLPVTSA